MASNRAALFRAYRTTTFRVDLPSGKVALRHGVPVPGAILALAPNLRGRWAHITAYNPGSTELAAPLNTARQRALEHIARACGFAVYPGCGEPEGADWTPEDACLLIGIDRSWANLLGALWGQTAIVIEGRRGRAEVASVVPPTPRVVAAFARKMGSTTGAAK